MVKNYRKKPVVIQAFHYDGKNSSNIIDWAGKGIQSTPNHYFDRKLLIETLEGQLTASVGDYIIKGVKGEFYACKPDVFAATYEEVE